MDDRGGNKYLYDAGDVVYEAAGGGTGTLILTGGNGVNSLAVDHTSDFLTEPGGAGSGSATIAATQEENYVPAVAGENPAAIPGAAFNQAGSVQTNQLMVEAPASEGADNLFAPADLQHQRDRRLYQGGVLGLVWLPTLPLFRHGNLPGNNGVLYYNYSGFTDIAGAGTDTDGMTAARQALVDEALDYLGEILGINFLQTTDTDSKVDIFYKDNDSGAYSDTNLLIWATLPITTSISTIRGSTWPRAGMAARRTSMTTPTKPLFMKPCTPWVWATPAPTMEPPPTLPIRHRLPQTTTFV